MVHRFIKIQKDKRLSHKDVEAIGPLGLAPTKAMKTKVQETESLAAALYAALKQQGWFKERLPDVLKDYDRRERMRHKRRIERRLFQFNAHLRKLATLDNDNFCSYMQWNAQHVDMGIQREDLFVEFATLFCTTGLAYCEALTRFFNLTLHRDKLGKRVKQPTYGSFAHAFKQNLDGFTESMQTMLDVDFRNALAHDSWYFNEIVSRFRYPRKKQTDASIPFYRLPMKIIAIIVVYDTITGKYFNDFMPNGLQHYDLFEGPTMFNDMPLMLSVYKMALSNKIKENE